MERLRFVILVATMQLSWRNGKEKSSSRFHNLDRIIDRINFMFRAKW